MSSQRPLRIACPRATVIGDIVFASLGNPVGRCGQYAKGSCHSDSASRWVAESCIGRETCTLHAAADNFTEPCLRELNMTKLIVQFSCTRLKSALINPAFMACSRRGLLC